MSQNGCSRSGTLAWIQAERRSDLHLVAEGVAGLDRCSPQNQSGKVLTIFFDIRFCLDRSTGGGAASVSHYHGADPRSSTLQERDNEPRTQDFAQDAAAVRGFPWTAEPASCHFREQLQRSYSSAP